MDPNRQELQNQIAYLEQRHTAALRDLELERWQFVATYTSMCGRAERAERELDAERRNAERNEELLIEYAASQLDPSRLVPGEELADVLAWRKMAQEQEGYHTVTPAELQDICYELAESSLLSHFNINVESEMEMFAKKDFSNRLSDVLHIKWKPESVILLYGRTSSPNARATHASDEDIFTSQDSYFADGLWDNDPVGAIPNGRTNTVFTHLCEAFVVRYRGADGFSDALSRAASLGRRSSVASLTSGTSDSGQESGPPTPRDGHF